MEIFDIARLFDIKGDITSIEPYGNGHINVTYLVKTDFNSNEGKYILQKINTNVFPRVDELMQNIANVTAYMRKIVLERGGNPDREVMTVVPKKDGSSYHIDESGAYRVYLFIDNTTALQIVDNASVFEGAGRAFGEFVDMLNGFDAKSLNEVIYNFHNTASRFMNFINAVDADKVNRRESVKDEIDFVLKRSGICDKIVTMLDKGVLPLRVTHNDTKLNNVLLDESTLEPVCVIDLDTIMPGSLLYDFGDAIRSGCNTGLEDEKDLSKVGFDINLYESFTRGFMSGVKGNITEMEVEMLSFGAILMTFECGMRFLTDYLDGDNYFRIHYPEHNLVRCRTQFKMVSDMEKLQNQMDEIARRYYKK